MPSGMSGKVTTEDVQMVQDLIEQCLPHYMTKEQVMDILFQQQKIKHEFTELEVAQWDGQVTVWQRLEEENQEFFKTYRLRLALTKQITDFNNLLHRQAALMKQVDPNRVTFRPMSNGSHIRASELPVSNGSDIPTSDMRVSNGSDIPTRHCLTSDNTSILMRTRNMQHVPKVLPSGFNSHGSSINSEMLHAIDMTTQYKRFDPLNMMWAPNLNIGMVQGMNGVEIKSQPNHLSNSNFAYRLSFGNIMEAHPRIDVASTSSYGNMEPNRHHLNGTLLNHTSFEVPRYLSQSQNIGRPDTVPNFNSLDVQSFHMSLFPLRDRTNMLDHHGSSIQNEGENRRLHDISGNLDFQNFGGH